MEGSTTTLATVISNIGTVFDGMLDWGGSVVTFIQANPLLLVGMVTSFSFVVVALIKRLLP